MREGVTSVRSWIHEEMKHYQQCACTVEALRFLHFRPPVTSASCISRQENHSYGLLKRNIENFGGDNVTEFYRCVKLGESTFVVPSIFDSIWLLCRLICFLPCRKLFIPCFLFSWNVKDPIEYMYIKRLEISGNKGGLMAQLICTSVSV